MLEPAFQSVGTLTIDKTSGETVYRNRTGFFEWYGTAPEGLSVHLPLDEAPGSTTAANLGLTGGSNDGTLDSPWLADPDFAAAKVLGGLQLSGTPDPDVVTAGPTPVTGSTPRTTAVWVKTDRQSGLMSLLTFGANVAGGKWDLDIDADHGGVLELGVGQGRTDGSGSPSLNDGLWHHVAAVLPDGGDSLDDVLLYVDGETIGYASGSRGVNTRSGGSLYLGRFANGVGQGFTGWLDDVAIWNRALSDVEMSALFSLGDVLEYNASWVDEMLLAFAVGDDVRVGDTLWYYWDAGLDGALGQVVVRGDGAYSIALGDGVGLATYTPEPASLALLALGALALAGRRCSGRERSPIA